MPYFKVGRRVRFNKSEVLTWLTKLEAARKN
jgi:excisionase family DNA binding protein